MIGKYHIFESLRGEGYAKICAVAFAVMMVAVTLAVVDNNSFNSAGEELVGIEIDNTTQTGDIGEVAHWDRDHSTLTLMGGEISHIHINCSGFDECKDVTIAMKGKNQISFEHASDVCMNAIFIENSEGNITITGSSDDSLNIIMADQSEQEYFAAILADAPQNANGSTFKVENVKLRIDNKSNAGQVSGIIAYGYSVEINNAKLYTTNIMGSVDANSVKLVKSELEFNFKIENESLMGISAISAEKGIKEEGCIMPDSGCQYWKEQEIEEGKNVPWENTGNIKLISYETSFHVAVEKDPDPPTPPTPSDDGGKDNTGLIIGIVVAVIIVIAAALAFYFLYYKKKNEENGQLPPQQPEQPQ